MDPEIIAIENVVDNPAELKFVVSGMPEVLERHRTTKTGKTYNPSAKKQKEFASKCVVENVLMGELEVGLVFSFERPKSHFNKGVLKESAPKHERKDVDNLVKFVLDALNKKVYKDDSQIVKITASKQYSDVAKTDILIKSL